MTKRKAPSARKPAGRPTDYTRELANEICSRIGGGESLVWICASPQMPRRQTVLDWVRTYPDFLTRYQHARDAQAHYLVDETLNTVRMAKTPEQIAKARLMLDATKWMAGKLSPKVYGERLEEQPIIPPQGDATLSGPNDIALARQLMYFIHKVMARQQTNGADPAPALLGVEHQSRH